MAIIKAGFSLPFHNSNFHSFSLSSCFICFSGSIKVFVSFWKSLTKVSSSAISNFLQIQEMNFSRVSQNLFIILCKWLFSFSNLWILLWYLCSNSKDFSLYSSSSSSFLLLKSNSKLLLFFLYSFSKCFTILYNSSLYASILSL